MFKPTDKPKRYLAAAAFAAVLITVPCLGALNTSADQARMEWPAPEHFEISSVYGSRYDHSDFHMGIDISDAEIANSDVVAARRWQGGGCDFRKVRTGIWCQHHHRP